MGMCILVLIKVQVHLGGHLIGGCLTEGIFKIIFFMRWNLECVGCVGIHVGAT